LKFGFNKLGGGAWNTAFRPQWPSWVVLLAGTFSCSTTTTVANGTQRGINTCGNIATQLAAFAYLLRYALPLWLNIDPVAAGRPSVSLLPTLFFWRPSH
jgi:hypothetical protein